MDYTEKYLKYKNKYLQLKKIADEKTLQKGGSKGGANAGADNTLFLFKAEWCPHCVAFKPVWEQLKGSKEYKNIKFVTYDADKDKSLMEQYNIAGFPTVILQNGSKMVEYNGNRDVDGLRQFIKNYN